MNIHKAGMNIHKNARLTPPGRLLLVQRDGWGPAAAAIAAGISERQSYRWLARYRSGGVAALADGRRDPAPARSGQAGRARPEAGGDTHERQRPGELTHLDTKKLGRIAGIGHRITGRARGAVNRHHGIGWEALHVCID